MSTEIQHVVLLELDTSNQTKVEEAMALARAIQGKIDGVIEVVAGPDISVEGLTDGLTHAVAVRFAGEAARERYLNHPAHAELGETMKPLLKRAVVVDIGV